LLYIEAFFNIVLKKKKKRRSTAIGAAPSSSIKLKMGVLLTKLGAALIERTVKKKKIKWQIKF
jgi:hypothetical protein